MSTIRIIEIDKIILQIRVNNKIKNYIYYGNCKTK